MNDVRTRWSWRKASGGWTTNSDDLAGKQLFHACDESNHLACSPSMGLNATVEQPNEGSQLCVECMDIVRGVAP